MKKKIRDITAEEIEKICDNNYKKYRSCDVCPLEGVNNCLKYLGLDLDKEIEVEENE